MLLVRLLILRLCHRGCERCPGRRNAVATYVGHLGDDSSSNMGSLREQGWHELRRLDDGRPGRTSRLRDVGAGSHLRSRPEVMPVRLHTVWRQPTNGLYEVGDVAAVQIIE